MSVNRFTISFKETNKDKKILDAINKIEKTERSQTIKEILYKYLVVEVEK